MSEHVGSEDVRHAIFVRRVFLLQNVLARPQSAHNITEKFGKSENGFINPEILYNKLFYLQNCQVEVG